MPKTHLPAHMDSARQVLRPKHQLLILKCYPRLPKNSAADVKPNGSELSYLLYYASTRRSKLQKVGAFLQKKTASDVYHWQSARVLVTLQILTALLENKIVGSGSGFALIAPYMLRIIRDILQNTNDISLIEAGTVTWDVFCRHQDHATLAADSEYRELYEHVVDDFAKFATKGGVKTLGRSAQAVHIQDAIRLRQAGLNAIKSVLASNVLAFETGRQSLNSVVPAILSNLQGDDAAYLEQLLRLSKKSEDEEKAAVNRRQSMSTARTLTGNTEVVPEPDPRAAEGTAQDADALAEEATAVLALNCFKTVFQTENRAQIRSATVSILAYLRLTSDAIRPKTTENAGARTATDSWASKLFEMSTAWTAVQDRFILLVTAVETLLHLPLKESDLRQHLLYTSLIDHILRSDLNLIGLSVMDVLLGLIQQTLNILQLGRAPMTAHSSSPTAQQDEELNRVPSAASARGISEIRLRLVVRLKDCIADLATHVYYTDQISDMILAVLLRLKPNTNSNGQPNQLATAAAIEEPKAAVSEIASNVASSTSLPSRGRSNSTNGYFSFDVARQIALETVKEIMNVANSHRAIAVGGVADSRNPIPLSIWEGTQWLLRDPAALVRRAYVDALTTWLELETRRNDARIAQPKPKQKKKQDATNGTLARRAASNASARERQARKATSSFLQLLHLASYENAVQFAATSESDILILHLLMATFVRKLGVNAVQSGLPMIITLQEEIARIDSPIAKVRIGSLVHGYLWSIIEVFECQQDDVGRNILAEILRRKQHRLWTRDVTYPPAPLVNIAPSTQFHKMDADFVAREELKPFDDRTALVDRVAEGYEHSVLSPPTSTPGSPGRNFSNTLSRPTELSHLRSSSWLGTKQEGGRTVPVSTKSFYDSALPRPVKDSMLAVWSKEECIAMIAATAPKSVSLSASRSSPSNALAAGNHRQLLAATNSGPPARSPSGAKLAQTNHRQQAFGHLDGARLHSQSPDRHNITTTFIGRHNDAAAADDTTSESLVDAEDDELGSDAGDTFQLMPLTDITSSQRLSSVGGTSKSSVTSSRDAKKASRNNLAALLDGISVDDATGVLARGRVISAMPPY
nr:protein efr3 [Quercus suber]